jgi:hypothetical protein
MKKKTIHYFINNNLCPYYHSDISSSPLLFGISGYISKGIIEIIYIKKRSSVNPCSKCEGMKWRKVLFFNYFVYYNFRKTKDSVYLCLTFLDKFLFIFTNYLKNYLTSLTIIYFYKLLSYTS